MPRFLFWKEQLQQWDEIITLIRRGFSTFQLKILCLKQIFPTEPVSIFLKFLKIFFLKKLCKTFTCFEPEDSFQALFPLIFPLSLSLQITIFNNCWFMLPFVIAILKIQASMYIFSLIQRKHKHCFVSCFFVFYLTIFWRLFYGNT